MLGAGVAPIVGGEEQQRPFVRTLHEGLIDGFERLGIAIQKGISGGQRARARALGWFSVDLTANLPRAHRLTGNELGETVDLSEYADADVTASGSGVPKWLGYAVKDEAGPKASWMFGPFHPDYVGDKKLTAEELATLETPVPSLPVGRYSLESVQKGATLEIYPRGAAFVSEGASVRRLGRIQTGWKTRELSTLPKTTFGGPTPPSVTLDVDSGAVTVVAYAGALPRTVKLTAGDRL